jgi:hypothetical protein
LKTFALIGLVTMLAAFLFGAAVGCDDEHHRHHASSVPTAHVQAR